MTLETSAPKTISVENAGDAVGAVVFSVPEGADESGTAGFPVQPHKSSKISSIDIHFLIVIPCSIMIYQFFEQ